MYLLFLVIMRFIQFPILNLNLYLHVFRYSRPSLKVEDVVHLRYIELNL